jgi:hypothetical protein
MTEWLAGLLTYWLYPTNNPISNCFWSYLNYRQIYLLFYLDFYIFFAIIISVNLSLSRIINDYRIT